MNTYLVLFRYTEQGLKSIKDSYKRVKNIKETLKAMGIEVKSIYSVMGQHDAAWIMNAPDAKTMAQACLHIGAQGYARSETYPAFPEEEYKHMIEQIA